MRKAIRQLLVQQANDSVKQQIAVWKNIEEEVSPSTDAAKGSSWYKEATPEIMEAYLESRDDEILVSMCYWHLSPLFELLKIITVMKRGGHIERILDNTTREEVEDALHLFMKGRRRLDYRGMVRLHGDCSWLAQLAEKLPSKSERLKNLEGLSKHERGYIDFRR